ncbi:MAG TPA: redoxin domain-containing protein [Haliangiales bacterium]|nr:redoxin domain-containing protein [Haliangiales bacterium]
MRFALVFVLFAATAAAAEIPSPGAPLPAFTVERWVNSAPLTPDALRGKVVLVDFWEYTCVNCIRTLPFVRAWHRDYASAGLVVVGVHAPEFDFGKRAENIDRGIREHGLTYPIAIDNDFATWEAFHNQSWPAKYLFDARGKLVKSWMGEGGYNEVEAEIRRLVLVANPAAKLPPVTREVTEFRADYARREGISPETYLGRLRREEGAVKLDDTWLDRPEYVEHAGDKPGKIALDVVAGEVNLVMQPGPSGKGEVKVLLDGKPVSAERGADVGPDGVARFDRAGMIRLVAKAEKKKHRLELVTSDPGLRAFAFTFGP